MLSGERERAGLTLLAMMGVELRGPFLLMILVRIGVEALDMVRSGCIRFGLLLGSKVVDLFLLMSILTS